jgi:hypothetical protein
MPADMKTAKVTCVHGIHIGLTLGVGALLPAQDQLNPVFARKHDIWYSVTGPSGIFLHMGCGTFGVQEILPCIWTKTQEVFCPGCSANLFTIQDAAITNMQSPADEYYFDKVLSGAAPQPQLMEFPQLAMYPNADAVAWGPMSMSHLVTDWEFDSYGNWSQQSAPDVWTPNAAISPSLTPGFPDIASASGEEIQGLEATRPPLHIEYDTAHQNTCQEELQTMVSEGRRMSFSVEELVNMEAYIEKGQREQELQEIEHAGREANLLYYMADLERKHPIEKSVFEDDGLPPPPVDKIVASFMA